MSCYKLYMIVGDRDSDTAMETFLGYTTNIENRLRQHNKADGGLRATRKLAGHWKIALVIVLPTHRGLSHRKLIEHWRQSSKKLNRCLEFGIKIARKLQVPWFVNAALFAQPSISTAIPQIISRYRREKVMPESVRKEKLSNQFQRLLASETTSAAAAAAAAVVKKKAQKRARPPEPVEPVDDCHLLDYPPDQETLRQHLERLDIRTLLRKLWLRASP